MSVKIIQKMKYLHINLGEYVQDQHGENYGILMHEIY